MSATSNKVVTGKVRLCWPHLFEPNAINPDDEPKFSVMALVPKSDKQTIAKMRAVEEKIKTDGSGKAKWGGKVPREVGSIIHDADEDGTAEDYPEREGCYYFSVNSSAKYPPGVVDGQVQPILDRQEIYSGVYARLSLTGFAYNFNGNKGVSFGLNHVQKMGEGEPLDGRTKAEDVFDEVETDDLI